MCGRFNIVPNAKAWMDAFSVLIDIQREIDELTASYNITPSQSVPIIRATAGGEGLALVNMRWGFVPHWVKEEKPKAQPINARSDTIATKPYFRDSYRQRRCLFIASGFYEWQTTVSGKQPFNIVPTNEEPFLMAGIWDTWRGDEVAAIVTTDANVKMQEIHDRMPVMIDHEQAKEWILGGNPNKFLAPCDSEKIRTYPVSKAVNQPASNCPTLIEPSTKQA